MKRTVLLASAFLLIAAGDPASETEHVVKEGETLRGVANRAGVPLGVIAAANGLVDPFDLRTGQVLAIPRQRSHKIKPGETSNAIARRYGVTLETLAIANALAPPYVIRTGQTLIVPAVVPDMQPFPRQRSEPYFRAPHDGEVLLGYRLRPDGGGHEGIDIAVARGDMVRASSGGTVVFAAEDSGRFGHLVVIDHGNGWRSRYGHLVRVTVKLGDVVKSGERVGIAGQGGTATRPELHFEIMLDGKPVDPADKLADTGGR